MLVVVIWRVRHSATGSGRVVALVLLERGRKTGGAVLAVLGGEGITIDIILGAGPVKVLLVQRRGQTTHADVILVLTGFCCRRRRRRFLQIHRLMFIGSAIVYTVPTAIPATAQ